MLRLWPRLHREPGPFVWSASAYGNCVPDLALRKGCAFPLEPSAETTSRNPVPEWDALSGSALNRKLCPGIDARNGMRFPLGLSAENVSRNQASEWDALSGTSSTGNCVPESTLGVGYSFRMEPQRKLRPSLSVYSGMQFPLGASAGNRVPFWALIPGHGFR